MHLENDLRNFLKAGRALYAIYYAEYKESTWKFFNTARFEYSLYERIKKEIDRYLSTDFNMIELIEPNENKLSDLITLILDDKGSHGQGDKFFKIFINHLMNRFDINLEENYTKYTVIREWTIDNNRRIDILIDLPNLIIAIENKPWTIDQENQIIDYLGYLEKQGRYFLLIYLHGYGKKSETISEKNREKYKNNFLETSYINFVVPWFEDCYKECESQKFRFFLEDFIKWVKNNFYNIEKD
ncbi:PDDEXK-like family protein [Persephonella sp.]